MTDTTTPTQTQNGKRKVKELERLVIRFAGDSGDGMQLTGDRFTSASAIMGNDLATLPDFPAEIRAPAGTVHGVSAFQVQISDHDITTPGEIPNVLVVMNPAALKSELSKLADDGTIIVNTDAFDERNNEKAGFKTSPLEDGSLDNYTVFEVPMTSLTKKVCKEIGVKPRDAERSKNFFALGLVSWLYNRTEEDTLDWVKEKFANNEKVMKANTAAFKAGHAFGETAEMFDYTYVVPPAKLPPGTYTNINGNTALAWGLVAASQLSKLPLFLGSYPITPASDVLHELSGRKNFGIRTLQAEDEIAAICSALGAAYGGHIGVTTTSGPGLSLKAEALGLAVSLELPLILVDIQRGSPSTGLPTKTEAADLLQAYFGRHGEAPLPIVAAYSPSHCFTASIEAVRLALKYRTPVVYLSDAYLANGSEPWCLPDPSTLPEIEVEFATVPNTKDEDGNDDFWPYLRDSETLARDWAIPGTPGLMHRIGGLEKADGSGNISYDPANHEAMVRLRAEKIARIANDIPLTWVNTAAGDIGGTGMISNAAMPIEPPADPESDCPDVLVLSWGSTWGAVSSAVRKVRRQGKDVDHAHLIHLCPFPRDLGDLLARYKTVLIPEINMGQLALLIRAKYLVDAKSITKVQGFPFMAGELRDTILAVINGEIGDQQEIALRPRVRKSKTKSAK